MRLPLLFPTILAVLLAGCIAWAEYTTWRELIALQDRLDGPRLNRLIEASAQWLPEDRESLLGVMTEAKESIDSFQVWLVASFVAMFLLIVIAARTVHQEMIAPLASKLEASHEVIARQEKLASLGILGTGVAHEIRNPLVAIKARLFSQQRKLVRNSPEYVDAEFINDEINRLEQIVRNFLQFARPADPCLLPVDTHEFFSHIVELMEPDVEKRNIKLKMETRGRLVAMMDSGQIKQLVINLIRNAAESIGSDGTITLRARKSFLPFNARPTPAVALEVEDDGPGIPDHVQPHIFDPFFTTKAAGVGLGLPIAERIAEKHGGSLQYRPEQKGLTRFTVTVPAAVLNEIPS